MSNKPLKLTMFLLIVFIAMLWPSAVKYYDDKNLYHGHPCRASFELNDKNESALFFLAELPSKQFCEKVLFNSSDVVIQNAIKYLLPKYEKATNEVEIIMLGESLVQLGFNVSTLQKFQEAKAWTDKNKF